MTNMLTQGWFHVLQGQVVIHLNKSQIELVYFGFLITTDMSHDN